MIAAMPLAASAQTTIVLQPDSANGKDAYIENLNPGNGQANCPEFNSCAWTVQGSPVLIRSLIDFNLSAIPAGSTIISATLTLYNNPNSSNGFMNGEHSHLSGSNAFLLQRITSPWIENVSWNTQPTTTTVNEVLLPQDTTPHQDYIIDVTQLTIDQLANPGNSFGFMLKLQTEQFYRLLAFASSDHPNSTLWPKLEITYITPCTNVLVLQPDSANGKDAFIDDLSPGVGQANCPEFNSCAWTVQGVPMIQRSLIDFNLSALPANATVQSATLTLYNNPNSSNGFMNGEHSHLSGSNASLIQRITSPWAENVTWNTQPTTTTVNETLLPQDSTPHQDYIIDVTQLTIDQINNPVNSFGFMLKLQTEQFYRLLAFASSDHPNPALWPKLEICYTTPSAVEELSTKEFDFITYPNPAHGQLYITSNDTIDKYILYDVVGREIIKSIAHSTSFAVNLDGVSKGVYFIEIKSGDKTVAKKIMVQ